MTLEDTVYPVYQCDECLVPWTVEGETFEAAYTFAVDAAGRPFDATNRDGLPI